MSHSLFNSRCVEVSTFCQCVVSHTLTCQYGVEGRGGKEECLFWKWSVQRGLQKILDPAGCACAVAMLAAYGLFSIFKSKTVWVDILLHQGRQPRWPCPPLLQKQPASKQSVSSISIHTHTHTSMWATKVHSLDLFTTELLFAPGAPPFLELWPRFGLKLVERCWLKEAVSQKKMSLTSKCNVLLVLQRRWLQGSQRGLHLLC